MKRGFAIVAVFASCAGAAPQSVPIDYEADRRDATAGRLVERALIMKVTNLFNF